MFHFHGCHWNGGPRCFLNRAEFFFHGIHENKYIWQEQNSQQNCGSFASASLRNGNVRPRETRTYQHAIFYDFESYLDKTQRKEATASLTYENAHVLISVRLDDMMERSIMIERSSTHICDAHPKELMWRFLEELERRVCLKIASCCPKSNEGRIMV